MSDIYLRLQDPGVRAALNHKALAGLPRLGRGAFCAVYDKGDTVLKLTCDTLSYEFGAGPIRPRGEHFPRLVESYGLVGATSADDPLYLFEVEKLQPVCRTSLYHCKKAVAALCNQVGRTCSRYVYEEALSARVAGVRTLEDMCQDPIIPPDMRKALDDLATFASNFEDSKLDFHRGNLMLRGDTIVLNDVLVSEPMFNKISW